MDTVKGHNFGVGWSEVAGKRFLMFLDDIASEEHINFLESIAADNDMAHSRFIVTSRDERLLRFLDQCSQTHLRDIPLLSNEAAMQLFCKCALLMDEEPVEWMKGIIEEIVKGCGGLPLTLEVMGTYLRTIRRESIWKELPGALRKAEALPPLERVWAKLRVSYDALQEEEKNVFLDLANAFIRDYILAEETIQYMLSSRCTSVSNILQSLRDKCLVKVLMEKPYDMEIPYEQRFHFQMHEHLRSGGTSEYPN
ncbi:hypothetical protein R1sor_022480 [Riccia sorocarpa]|uniref:NB-ARC domain-containing protein n=1 Tax=Riccia sorocarpa TaxID=122646 RepID=A0ABD3GP69_9MARC